jgi:hypothetical protein
VKRILSALAAAASIATLALGAAGTANAAEKEAPPPAPNLYIKEAATRGTGPAGAFQEYIEIATRSAAVTLRTGVNVMAISPAGPPMLLTTIPAGTTISRGQVYTVAHAGFTACPPNQIFTENLRGNAPVQLWLIEPRTGTIVSRALVRPHPPRLSRHWSPSGFILGPRTPCV